MSASDALAYYALPLAVGILGTLLAMGVFGRKLPGDRSNEVDELQMLLAHRDQELENLESAAATTLARMQDAKTEIERISLAEAQRRKAIAAANLAELEYAEKSGTLIDKAGAEKVIFEFVRGLRDAIENFPVRYAAQIGAELGAPAVKVNAALSKRLKDYLVELADRQLRL